MIFLVPGDPVLDRDDSADANPGASSAADAKRWASTSHVVVQYGIWLRQRFRVTLALTANGESVRSSSPDIPSDPRSHDGGLLLGTLIGMFLGWLLLSQRQRRPLRQRLHLVSRLHFRRSGRNALGLGSSRSICTGFRLQATSRSFESPTRYLEAA